MFEVNNSFKCFLCTALLCALSSNSLEWSRPGLFPVGFRCITGSLRSEGRVVSEVVDLERLLEPARGILQLVQMERLRLVELVPVGGSELVGVKVLLRPPMGSVPELSVAFIAGDKRGTVQIDFQESSCVEFTVALSGPEVWLIVGLWVLVTFSEGRIGVFFRVWFHVGSCLFVCATTKSSAVCL